MTIEEPVVDAWGDTATTRHYLEFNYQTLSAVQGQVRITNVLRNIEGRRLIVHHHEGLVRTGIPFITN